MEQKRKRGYRGYTLVEMMTVMTILALLASITIPSFLKYLGKVEMASCSSEAEVMFKIVRIYIAEQYTAGTLSRENIRKDIMDHELGDPDNVLTGPWRGSYSNGARIISVYATITGSLKGMTYEVNGYRIEMCISEETGFTRDIRKKEEIDCITGVPGGKMMDE